MSGSYRLTASARVDLHHLEDVTMDSFGLAQVMALQEAFENAFMQLADNPLTGHLREDLSPPGRALRYWTVLRRFLIVYEPTDSGIIVVRLFDGAQDVKTILRE